VEQLYEIESVVGIWPRIYSCINGWSYGFRLKEKKNNKDFELIVKELIYEKKEKKNYCVVYCKWR